MNRIAFAAIAAVLAAAPASAQTRANDKDEMQTAQSFGGWAELSEGWEDGDGAPHLPQGGVGYAARRSGGRPSAV